ncbi:RrF2 family transcriptional regulator [Paenisporosarcina cavernae]|uniref:HTH-type transcriptional regulator NsrR n=1 Tax=Paenisporosarcina cavernae TaxID=2320858 RepID=A0A385YWX5_9BACL|nr:Rrf2 family transcriptional regulator [Paenisporosarcina cavernae]AYC30407.1 Rrf2 family transcriptional regulator [Paenisporosarcina cavernae]
MRLTMYSDFSLRVLMYVGTKESGELSTIREISEAYGISKNHLMKVTYDLAKLGYIHSTRGRGGGIRLAIQPKEINIGKLIRQTEDDFYLVECFDCARNKCVITPVCYLKGILAQALRAYLAVLDGYTLEDLLENKAELRSILVAPTNTTDSSFENQEEE